MSAAGQNTHKAQQELIKGDRYVSSHQYAHAYEHYRKSYAEAMKK